MEIILDHVTKIYKNGKVAVDDLSLALSGKEFVTVVGPSGCGKTTLLRLIAGLEKVTRGSMTIDGKDAALMPPKERSVTMVFQNYALFPYMNVYDNIAFGLKVAGEDKKSIDEKVSEAARLLGLSSELRSKPRELSGGQRQRVVLGRAMVRRPRLCLLDEPLSNLDYKLRSQMRAEIKELYDRLDATFIYVTHDQSEAMTLGERVLVMEGGKLRQFDTPRNVYDRPADKFVASFVGQPEMNFLDGTVSGGKLSVCGKTYDVDLPDGDVTVGIRAEDVRVAEPCPEAIAGTVASREISGRDVTLFVQTEWGRIAVKSPFAVDKGGTVRFVLPAEYLRFFDPETGAGVRQ